MNKDNKWITIDPFTSNKHIDEINKLLFIQQMKFDEESNSYSIDKHIQLINTYDVIPNNMYGDHANIENIATLIQTCKIDNTPTYINIVLDDIFLTKYCLRITKDEILNIPYKIGEMDEY